MLKGRPSASWQPLKQQHVDGDVQFWENRLYRVRRERKPDGWIADGGSWVLVEIHAKSGRARHDWREFQQIKNEVIGPEAFAIEIYPAESNLRDAANCYMLFCCERPVDFGHKGRRIAFGSKFFGQRPWPKGATPKDACQMKFDRSGRLPVGVKD